MSQITLLLEHSSSEQCQQKLCSLPYSYNACHGSQTLRITESICFSREHMTLHVAFHALPCDTSSSAPRTSTVAVSTRQVYKEVGVQFFVQKVELQLFTNLPTHLYRSQLSFFTTCALHHALQGDPLTLCAMLFFLPALIHYPVSSETALSDQRPQSPHRFPSLRFACFRSLFARNYSCLPTLCVVAVCPRLRVAFPKPTLFLLMEPTPGFISLHTSFSFFVLTLRMNPPPLH